MGQLVSRREVVLRSSLVASLREAPLADVVECKQTFDDLGEDLTLSFDDFDEVFGLLVGDTEEVFKIFADPLSRNADSLEVFSAAFLLCNADDEHRGFESKVQAVFELFDFDRSGAISQPELVMLLRAVVTGLTKLTVGIEPPGLRELQRRAHDLFGRMDADGSGSVTLPELVEWAQGRDEVLVFLNAVVGAPFLGAYVREFENLHAEWQIAFHERTVRTARAEEGRDPNPWCRAEDVAAVLQEHRRAALSAEEAAAVVGIVQRASPRCADGFVDASTFAEASRPLAAFEVVDRDRGGTLDVRECKLLMWLMEGAEPDMARVMRDQRAMDADGSGAVSRVEWLRFIMVERAGPGKGLALDLRVKRLFDEIDVDGNGIVSSMLELLRVLLGLRSSSAISDVAATSATQDTSGDNAEHAMFLPLVVSANSAPLVEAMAADLAHAMIAEFDTSGDGFIEWREFATHISAFREKVNAFRAYVRTLP